MISEQILEYLQKELENKKVKVRLSIKLLPGKDNQIEPCLIFKDRLCFLYIENTDINIHILYLGKVASFSLFDPNCFDKTIEFVQKKRSNKENLWPGWAREIEILQDFLF